MSAKQFSYAGSAVLMCIVLATAAWAAPTYVSIDVSSLNGTSFQLEIALYDNSGVLGDTWALIDNVTFGPQGEDFESGTTGGFDNSLNPDSVNAVSGSLTGAGSFLLRIDEDPAFNPTFTFMDFTASSDWLLSFMYDIAASVTTGSFGLDQLVFSILDPVTLSPLIPGITVDFGDALAVDAEGMQYKEKQRLSVSSTAGGVVTAPGEGDFEYIQYDNPAYTTVPVRATPEPHHHFVKWTGSAVDAGNLADPSAANTFVSLDADYTLCAVFAIDRHTITVTSTAGGTVISPGTGSFEYEYGASIFLEAQAAPLFAFDGWRGSLHESTPSTEFIVDGDYHIYVRFLSLLDILYVDDDTLSDSYEDGTAEHPFDSIQEAIEVARDGTQVLVDGGIYYEQIDLIGKGICVQGRWLCDPNVTEEPIVDGNGVGPVVTFSGGEDANCVLAGLRIQGGYAPYASAIMCSGSPTIANCLIVGNRANGGALIHCAGSPVFINCTITENAMESNQALIACSRGTLTMSNSILWGNTSSAIRTISGSPPVITYCNIEGGWTGLGNTSIDPSFVASGSWTEGGISIWLCDDIWTGGDYHLLSEAGHWDSASGTYHADAITSPCIDAGDPSQSYGAELTPNGGRINMGAYGGTNQASLSDQ